MVVSVRELVVVIVLMLMFVVVLVVLVVVVAVVTCWWYGIRLPCRRLHAPSFGAPMVVTWHRHLVFVVVGVCCYHCGRPVMVVGSGNGWRLVTWRAPTMVVVGGGSGWPWWRRGEPGCCRRWWPWVVAVIGDGGEVVRPVVVDNGGGEQTTVVGCLMMPNRASGNTETQFGRGQHTFTYNIYIINVYY